MVIFEKQHKELEQLKVIVDGQRSKEQGPRPLETIHMVFTAKGKGITQKDLEFAVNLSAEKYCGVHATLAKSAAISWEAKVEN